jgi:transcriptional regulator with XRE-family HTH domain
MPAGRPTLYESRFCDLLIEHMSKGLSYESFAGFIGVSKQTIYDWEKANPEFLDAKNIGTEKARLWWEQKAADYLINTDETIRDSEGNMTTKRTSLNSTVWIFNMKNRFKEDWKDRHDVTQTNFEGIRVISGDDPPEGE